MLGALQPSTHWVGFDKLCSGPQIAATFVTTVEKQLTSPRDYLALIVFLGRVLLSRLKDAFYSLSPVPAMAVRRPLRKRRRSSFPPSGLTMARRRYSHRSISITAAVCYSPRGTDDAMVNPLAALELPVPLLSEQIKQDSDGTCRVSDAEEDDEQVGLTPEVVNMREVELAGSPLSSKRNSGVFVERIVVEQVTRVRI